MGINIGDYGGALAGAISKDLRTQREKREARQQKQLDEHSEAVNIAKKKLKPVFVKDLQIKAKKVSDQFNALKIPISKTTVYKIATDGYKEFETLRRDKPFALQQFAGSASDDPSFDLQQAIELAAEEKATKDIVPFMPPEEKSFLGFKVSSGERKIEREAKRLGMTAEEYKEFGSGAISAPQVDVTLDRSVLSDVTDKELREQQSANITRLLLLPDSEENKIKIENARKIIAAFPKAKGKVTQSDVFANIKFAQAAVETQLGDTKYGKKIPQSGFVINPDLKDEDLQMLGLEFQKGIRPVLNEYLRVNNITPTNDIENDIDKLVKVDIEYLPFKAAIRTYNQKTLRSLVKNQTPVGLASRTDTKNYGGALRSGKTFEINPRVREG